MTLSTTTGSFYLQAKQESQVLSGLMDCLVVLMPFINVQLEYLQDT